MLHFLAIHMLGCKTRYNCQYNLMFLNAEISCNFLVLILSHHIFIYMVNSYFSRLKLLWRIVLVDTVKLYQMKQYIC